MIPPVAGLPSRDADGSEALGALAQGPMLESNGGSEETACRLGVA